MLWATYGGVEVIPSLRGMLFMKGEHNATAAKRKPQKSSHFHRGWFEENQCSKLDLKNHGPTNIPIFPFPREQNVVCLKGKNGYTFYDYQ